MEDHSYWIVGSWLKIASPRLSSCVFYSPSLSQFHNYVFLIRSSSNFRRSSHHSWRISYWHSNLEHLKYLLHFGFFVHQITIFGGKILHLWMARSRPPTAPIVPWSASARIFEALQVDFRESWWVSPSYTYFSSPHLICDIFSSIRTYLTIIRLLTISSKLFPSSFLSHPFQWNRLH